MMEISDISKLAGKIKENICKVIVGKEDAVELVITALIAGGHVLLEDVPGTGKTMLAKSLAKSVGVDFKRVQFTPDLLPSDLTGINYYNQKEGDFTFRKGPVFTNILLADEINRAAPRTQSSLLECMEEKQVTIDGVTRKLKEPYFVIATQNPIETQGTFMLPEAQLDRFLIKMSIGYPSTYEAGKILKRFINDDPFEKLDAVCSYDEICSARESFKNVFVSPDILKYIVDITEKTRKHNAVMIGVSPRGSLALLRASQAYAAIKGRKFVNPEDVKKLAVYVFGHRVILKDEYKIRDIKADSIIKEILNEVPVPTEKWDKE